jgi:hypothetical protein
MKKLLSILILATSLNIAHAQGNLIDSRQLSEAEVLKVVTNPQNQAKVELVMFVLKSIEDLNITENDKKIDFVNKVAVSDNIKDMVKNDISQNITYSDYKRVSYGMYKLMNNKCSNSSNSLNVNGLPDHINLRGNCYPQEYFTC